MTLSMPAAPNFKSSRFRLQAHTEINQSPTNRSTEILELDGERWMLTVTLPKMSRAQAAPWKAFLTSCRGRAKPFYGFDPDARTPLGVATGTPLVKGGGQVGNTLLIDGCTPNITGWLRAGDYFGVNGQLVLITQNANTDGSGETTLTFEAPMRSSPADNAPITVINPTCTMILIDDDQAGWDGDTNGTGTVQEISFSAVEIF